jgi:peptidoglycan/xylan/chitin deacetylase (PgdA/CDA1 family)
MRIVLRPLSVLALLTTTVAAQPPRAGAAAPSSVPTPASRPANRLGVIPVLEYHLIGDRESRWSRSWQQFAKDLELLHARGYRPITIRQLLDKQVEVGAGLSPIVITFDDASPGQFRFVARGDSLVVDPTSAVGVWEAFAATHPEWKGRAVFCMLPSATEGHAFFGDKGIQGQRTEWRMRKVQHLARGGYELCNHTLWHANLSRMSAAGVQEQIARAQLALDSAGTGVRMRTMALPLGIWPKDRALLRSGSWTDPRTKRTTSYAIDAILMVSGGPAKSPFDPAFDPLRIPRVQVFANELVTLLDRLDRHGLRYVSAGPAAAARPR